MLPRQVANSEYRIFRPTFRARDGSRGQSSTYHIEFKDHVGRRQRIIGFKQQRDTIRFAEKLLELVRHRRHAEPLDDSLRKFLDTLPEPTRERLAGMDLISRARASVDTPLLLQVRGEIDAAGKLLTPGWKQEIAAKGTTSGHINTVTRRVERLLESVGFVQWRDVHAPDAAGRVQIHLGTEREKGNINGTSYNYAVRDFKRFCTWAAKRLGTAIPMLVNDLVEVDNEDTDKDVRRELSAEEMCRLIAAAEVSPDSICGLTGPERAFLYQFCFETGLRPNQVRSLTVASFDLEADPPVVRSQARFVKTRTPHTQVLRREMGVKLAEMFKTKLPTAPAFHLPIWKIAGMLRKDLHAARTAWLAERRQSDKEHNRRLKSDFLQAVNHAGEKAVFYSLRHAHGTALAAAGVNEKDIAKSMHHTNRSTTQRYLHTRQPELERAIAALPNVAYPSARVGVSRKHRRKRVSGNDAG